jgi:hypothetical protein
MMRRMGDTASTTPAASDAAIDATTRATHEFIARWRGVTASELSAAQSFANHLCDLLGAASTPHPTPEQSYMFERPITFQHGDGSYQRRAGGLLPTRPLRAGRAKKLKDARPAATNTPF